VTASRRRILAAALCAAVTTGGAVLAPAVPGGAAPLALVALGDSYASGLGTRSYFPASGACERSRYAYPARVARRLGVDLTFVACEGATTRTVRRQQLGALAAGTTDVSLTVGGNDAGFSSVLTACALPRWASDCDGAIHDARVRITGTLPRRLNRLYRSVRSRAPQASVVVPGYPRLFNGEDCNAATWFSPREEKRLNASADLLDKVIRRRARAHGFSFVDPRRAFTGHEVCADREWINGLSYPLNESYHPNRAGQRAYASIVDRALR
jgi:lysophospholipase L1-like esterase